MSGGTVRARGGFIPNACRCFVNPSIKWDTLRSCVRQGRVMRATVTPQTPEVNACE